MTEPVVSTGGGITDAPDSPVQDVDPGIRTATVPTAPWEERFTSYDVDAFEVPGGREEQWRFTPLRRLRGLHDGSAAADGAVPVTVAAGFGDDAVVADDVLGGTRIERGVGSDDPRIGDGGIPADRVAAAAWSGFTAGGGATVVTVDEARSDNEPLTITVDGPGEGATAHAHLQLRLERHAEAVVVVDHRGSGTVAANTEYVVGDGATLVVVEVHDWADDAVYVGAQHLSVGRDASIRHTSVTLGGDLVRLSPVVNYRDTGGDVELDGLYFADGGQHFEQRLLVDHSIPHCRSNVMYKGALQGTESGHAAHTVWIGDVLIRKAAEGTETYELNRNLLLTDHARADSVPNLEIETGEIVSAGHASATGRFDDEQLFYLMSRGIPEVQARRLVVRGFFGEVINKIRVPALRDRLEAAVETELEAVGA